MDHETHTTHTEECMVIISNWQWILDSSFCLLFVALNGLILISEIKTRRQSTTRSSLSKYTKMWPIVCMTCGLCVELCGLVAFLPGFCYFTRQLEFFLSSLQGVSMGFFQLSRLYYLFMVSGKGYSNVIFIFMYTIGILILMAIAIVSFLIPHINYCSLDNKLNYIEHSEYFYWFNDGYSTVIYVFVICVSVYIEWDLITLMLYIWKLIPFYFSIPSLGLSKSCTDKQMNSIKSILCKIIILTFVYEMTVILVLNDVFVEMAASSNIIHIDSILVFIFLEGLLSTSMSYAILLMQQHNQKKYIQFLKVVHWLKCDICICCCCKSVIRSELKLVQSQSIELTNLTSVLETEQLCMVVEETTVNINTFPTHSSKNQATSRGSNCVTKLKTNDDLSSVTLIGVPTLKRDKVSQFCIGDSLTNTF